MKQPITAIFNFTLQTFNPPPPSPPPPSTTNVALKPELVPWKKTHHNYHIKIPIPAIAQQFGFIFWYIFSKQFMYAPSLENRVSYLVTWCFEPSQPQRITSGLNKNFILSPSYSLHKSLHNKSYVSLAYLYSAGTQHGNLHPAGWTISLPFREMLIKIHTVERTSKAEVGQGEQSEKVENCWKN